MIISFSFPEHFFIWLRQDGPIKTHKVHMIGTWGFPMKQIKLRRFIQTDNPFLPDFGVIWPLGVIMTTYRWHWYHWDILTQTCKKYDSDAPNIFSRYVLSCRSLKCVKSKDENKIVRSSQSYLCKVGPRRLSPITWLLCQSVSFASQLSEVWLVDSKLWFKHLNHTSLIGRPRVSLIKVSNWDSQLSRRGAVILDTLYSLPSLTQEKFFESPSKPFRRWFRRYDYWSFNFSWRKLGLRRWSRGYRYRFNPGKHPEYQAAEYQEAASQIQWQIRCKRYIFLGRWRSRRTERWL